MLSTGNIKTISNHILSHIFPQIALNRLIRILLTRARRQFVFHQATHIAFSIFQPSLSQARSLQLRHFWFNHMWWILICSLCEFGTPGPENQPLIHAYRTCTCSCKLPFAERAPRDHMKAIVHAYSPFRWGGSSIENTPKLGGWTRGDCG